MLLPTTNYLFLCTFLFSKCTMENCSIKIVRLFLNRMCVYCMSPTMTGQLVVRELKKIWNSLPWLFSGPFGWKSFVKGGSERLRHNSKILELPEDYMQISLCFWRVSGQSHFFLKKTAREVEISETTVTSLKVLALSKFEFLVRKEHTFRKLGTEEICNVY